MNKASSFPAKVLWEIPAGKKNIRRKERRSME